MVIKRGGSVWATDWNEHDQLVDGTRVRKNTFCSVEIIRVAKAVAAGSYHSILLQKVSGLLVPTSMGSSAMGWRRPRALASA